MTLSEAYADTKKKLQFAGIESSGFEALCLMKKFFGADRADIAVRGDSEVDEAALSELKTAVLSRTVGRPLQYILGEWELCGRTFDVGDGVLIPRQETELLVEAALKAVENIRAPKIIDLCGGSGCIAICLAAFRPDAKITTVELSDIAYWYLAHNIEKNAVLNVTPIKADVLDGGARVVSDRVDLIVSNPPYIRTEELRKLQKEVKSEPRMALDGGADGLKFYRAIAEGWLPYVKPGGRVAVEIGVGQAPAVRRIFNEAYVSDITAIKDLNNIYRVVTGTVTR